MSRSTWSCLMALLLRRAVPEMLVLIALGVAAGLALNRTHSDPLPFDLPGSLLLSESGAETVFLSRARRLFEDGEYVFVDARREEAFISGHIEGAFSLPAESFRELYPLLKTWTGGQPILVYGAAGNPIPVDDLARLLGENGEERVALLADGYSGWVARGYPVEEGAEGILDEW